MKIVRDEQKNSYIKQQFGRNSITFKVIAQAIIKGEALYDGPNDIISYESQKMFIVKINGYPYKVPYMNLVE